MTTTLLQVDYSPEEINLIKALDFKTAQTLLQHLGSMTPANVYRQLAEDCFVNNRTGPAVDALRRVCKAIFEGEPYRMTPEFNKLAEFTNEDEFTCGTTLVRVCLKCGVHNDTSHKSCRHCYAPL